MDQIFSDSLVLHEKLKGKLEIRSKVALLTKMDLSLAYTPGVAQVCREISEDKSEVRKYTMKGNTVAVVTDGSAILGLGNLGPEAALPVMEGKAILFKEFAGIDAFPICLDTQDSEEIIKTVKYLAPVFGGINLEDISAPRCFEIERRLINELNIPVMHDDQRGTATVVLAALINALRVADLDKQKVRVVINGAGAAGSAIAKMLKLYGIQHIVACDTQGLIYKTRPGLTKEKQELAELLDSESTSELSLGAVISGKDIFIGVSAGNVLTQDMIRSMNSRPIVFALANPIPEIMPDLAMKAGAYIVATGRSDFPNQINNVLAFPGIFRGALDHNVQKINDSMLLKAAESLASYVSNVDVSNILPSPLDKGVVDVIAGSIV